jgi:hypothetical protein
MQMTREPEHAFEPIIRLSAQWRRGGAWLGPAWAVICGLIATASFRWESGAVVTALVALIVAEGLWATFWAAVAETDWSAPLGRWRTWQDGQPVKPLPYAQPGSSAERFAIVLGQFRDWAARDLLPGYGSALASIVVAPFIALILSAILGAPAILLCILAISLPQLALAFCRSNGRPSVLLHSMVQITLPVLLGFVLYKQVSTEIVIIAFGFGLTYAGMVAARPATLFWNLGQAIVLILLIATRHSVGAFIFAALWLPQFLMQSQPSPRHAQWWLMASMIVAAISIA